MGELRYCLGLVSTSLRCKLMLWTPSDQYHELGQDGKTRFKIPIFARKEFGAPWLLNHRVDLHNELRRLATTEAGEGKPATVRTAARVVQIVSALCSLADNSAVPSPGNQDPLCSRVQGTDTYL